MVSAEFACRACGAEAGRVVMLDAGEVPPRLADGFPSAGLLDDPRSRRLIVAGPVATASGPYEPKDARAWPERALLAAIRGADGAALFKMDPELAPFWCPECEGAYCRTHWNKQTNFDDGFYDTTYGTCPRGHRRMLDD